MVEVMKSTYFCP